MGSSPIPSRRRSPGSPESAKSTPASPVLSRPTLSVLERVQSWERLSNTVTEVHFVTGARSKQTPSPVKKVCTRRALVKGLTSPLTAPGDFKRKKRTKAAKPIKRKKLKELKEKVEALIITMAQAAIPRAGRLNPTNRRAGGVGDTVAGLGFPELATDDISDAGKITVRQLTALRIEIVTDANLVIRSDQLELQGCKEVLEGYLTDISDSYGEFRGVAADIAEGNENGLAVANEIIKLKNEIKGLHNYCKVKIANRPAAAVPGAVGGADQVRLARLNFPKYDGKSNFKNWKTAFDTLIALVPQEEVKKSHLLDSLEGFAERYINSIITPVATYVDIRAKSESRYNDPLVINYNLLDRMFNNPEMEKAKSTQAHCDTAVGDINAIIGSGMTIDEILVYYKLHKFQPRIIREVKLQHGIK